MVIPYCQKAEMPPLTPFIQGNIARVLKGARARQNYSRDSHGYSVLSESRNATSNPIYTSNIKE